MENISARDARIKFAEVLDSSRDNPVIINKYGRDFAVLLSTDRYKELLEMEGEMLSILAKEIDKKEEYIGMEASNIIIDDILNA